MPMFLTHISALGGYSRAGMLALGLAVAAAPAPALAQSPQRRNLAYTESFVLYLAGRLAYRLEVVQRAAGAKLEEQAWYPLRADYQMLYRRHLIACGGPLPQLAELFKFFDPDEAQPTGTLAALDEASRHEREIMLTVDSWAARIQSTLLAEFRSGDWQIQPACVDTGYARQNPIPAMPGSQ